MQQKRNHSPNHKQIQKNQKDQRKLKTILSQCQLNNNKTLSQNQFHIIGNYKYFINKLLGKGFSSKVYYGTSIYNPQNQYAIKIVDTKDMRSQSKKMLINQIQILKQLNCDYILKLYDVYQQDNYVYLITQYCQRGSLENYILVQGKLKQIQAIKIMQYIIQGYCQLIRSNIIHRDLKPDNILRTKDGWKIADFGFAIKSANQYKSKDNVGSPLYMPLQALNHNLYSAQSDIFSIGIIFYQLLVGHTPWPARTQKLLIQSMLTKQFKFPQTVIISQQLKILIKRLCNPKKNERMNKYQFLSFNFQQLFNIPLMKGRKLTFMPQQLKQLRQSIKQQTLKLPISPRGNLLDIQSQIKARLKDKTSNNNIFNNNVHIIINQTHYCRFLYYMIKNNKYFLMQSYQLKKLTVILFKHILHIITKLSDSQNNYWKFQQWNQFRKTSRYLSARLTANQYLQKYKKQYKQYLQNLDSDIIDIIQQQTNFMNGQQLTQQSYQSIKLFIIYIIKGYKRKLPYRLQSHQTPIIKAIIQGVKSLMNYRRLLQICQTLSDIYVVINYINAPQINQEEFMKVRKYIDQL